MAAISLIVWLVVLIKVTIPNYHGSQFKIGECNLVSKYIADFNNVPWKDCSCGMTCTSQFPCIDVKAYYTPHHKNSKKVGSLHDGYWSLNKGCFVLPKCARDPDANQRTVWDFVNKFLSEHSLKSTESTFICWAFGDSFYFENTYSAKAAHLALFLPLIFLVISVTLVIISSEKAKACCFTCCMSCWFSRRSCCLKCRGTVSTENNLSIPNTRPDPFTPVEMTGANTLFYEHYHSSFGASSNFNEPPPPPYKP